MNILCQQVPEEALAHSFVTYSSVMATSYTAKVAAMARRNARKDAYLRTHWWERRISTDILASKHVSRILRHYWDA